MNSLKCHLLTSLGTLALVASSARAEDQITAQLRPKSLSLGDSAQLTVTVSGPRPAAPGIPPVDGLEIVRVGQQRSIRIINGVVTADAACIYRVTPNRVGQFTIPAITASGAGSTQPLSLMVEPGTGGTSRGAASRNRSALRNPGGSSDDQTPAKAGTESAFLRVILPKQELTVGELVPVEVKAYFRADVSASLNGLPMLSSDAFALDKLSDEPGKTRQLIDGVPYTVITWTSALSAVKAGDYPLNIDLPVMVRVQERGRSSPFGGSMDDDSFFDRFFGGTTEKPLTLHTSGSAVKIKALPTEGRPAGFSGAVGDFEITAEADGASGMTGDPLKLKITLAGQGNFSRVSTGGLPASAAWKSYQPSVQLHPSNSSQTVGTKVFEQSIVPLKAGKQEIPPLSFSFFNPETESYVTKKAAPIAIEVGQSTVTPAAENSGAAVPAKVAPETPADGLVADRMIPARATASLRPLVLQPWFIALNAAMLGALGLGAAVRAICSRRANNPGRLQRQAAERAVMESLTAMDAALAAKDAPRFFEAARHAVQQRLAAQWHVPASQVTIPEIRTRLNGHGGELSALFQTADELAYSGKRFTPPDLAQWRDIVKNQLRQLSLP